MSKKKTVHYVDNKKFLQAMKDWKESCIEAEEAGEEKPPVTNYIGECFLKIDQMVYHIGLILLTTLIVLRWYQMG